MSWLPKCLRHHSSKHPGSIGTVGGGGGGGSCGVQTGSALGSEFSWGRNCFQCNITKLCSSCA